MLRPRLYYHVGSLPLGVRATMMQQKYNNHPAIPDPTYPRLPNKENTLGTTLINRKKN